MGLPGITNSFSAWGASFEMQPVHRNVFAPPRPANGQFEKSNQNRAYQVPMRKTIPVLKRKA